MAGSAAATEFGSSFAERGGFDPVRVWEDVAAGLDGWTPSLPAFDGFRPLTFVERPDLPWRSGPTVEEMLDPRTGEMLTAEALGGPPAIATGAYVGLTAVKFYFSEDGRASKFGTVSDILTDIGASGLGVSFVRQTGFADLEWPGDEVPVADGTEASLSDLSATIGGTLMPTYRKLADVFQQASAANVKLVLTFLRIAAGGAWAGSTRLSTEPTDPLGEGDADTTTWLNWGEVGTTHVGTVEAEAYRREDGTTAWSINDTLSLVGDQEGVIDVSSAAGNAAQWVWSTLDPRSPYKLRVVQEIARQWVEVLERARTAAGVAALSDVVESIELYNEVNRKTVFRGSDGSPLQSSMRGWARLVAAAVAGFEEGFSANSSCRVSLGWPSLAEYTKDASVGTFTETGANFATLAFVSDLVRETQTELGRYGHDLSKLSNMGYHSYHYQSSVGALQAARFARDANRIEALMAAGGAAGRVSVNETGIPAFDASTSANLSDEYVTLYSRVLAGDFSGSESFQARDLWRRLATHLAAGVRTVAWQTHVATASEDSAFRRTGLRADAGSDSDATPADATPRESWWALRRLVALLMPSGLPMGAPGSGILGTVLTPRPPYGAEVLRLAQGAADGFVILQFLGAGRVEFIYVIFVDPTFPSTDPVRLWINVVGSADGVPYSGTRLDFAPVAFTWTADGAGFPVADQLWRQASVALDGQTFEFRRDEDPVLIRTPHRLEFWDISGPGSDPRGRVVAKFASQLVRA